MNDKWLLRLLMAWTSCGISFVGILGSIYHYIKTNDGVVPWCIYSSFGLDELTTPYMLNYIEEMWISVCISYHSTTLKHHSYLKYQHGLILIPTWMSNHLYASLSLNELTIAQLFFSQDCLTYCITTTHLEQSWNHKRHHISHPYWWAMECL